MTFRMQFAIPEAFDTTNESNSTLKIYGDSEYAKGCLLARQLVRPGVRMVQLSHSSNGYDIAWAQDTTTFLITANSLTNATRASQQ